MTKVSASILSADFAALGEAVSTLADYGADYIHCDVMDGHYVNNMTFGPPMIEALRKHTNLPLDVHLMMIQPERYVPAFAAAGADIITFHPESTNHPHAVLVQIRSFGLKAGVALNPGTSVCAVSSLLDLCSIVLLLAVNPGFGGQKFNPSVLTKAGEIRQLVGKEVDIEIDGGINATTAGSAVRAGIDVLVAGSAIFSAADPRVAISSLKLA